jgi:hypothetical protein
MQFSAITLVLFAGVAILFVGGVGLIWVGLRSSPDRLPRGADEILDAISEGRLGPPPEPDADDDGGSVRLVPRDEPIGVTPAPTIDLDEGTRVLATVGPAAERSGDGAEVDDDELTLTEQLFFSEAPELKKF